MLGSIPVRDTAPQILTFAMKSLVEEAVGVLEGRSDKVRGD